MSARVLPARAGVIAGGTDVRVRLGLADDLLTDLSDGRLDLVVSAIRPRRAGARDLAEVRAVLPAAARN